MFWFDFCFPKVAEAVNSKMTGWRSSELIGFEMQRSVHHEASIQKGVSISIGYHFIDLSSSTIKKIV